MAVRLRLTRMGAKKKPYYRLVAADVRSPRDGRFLELLGTYDPGKDPPQIRLKEERIRAWLRRGAEVSDTASQLLKRAGFWQKEGEKEQAVAEVKPDERVD